MYWNLPKPRVYINKCISIMTSSPKNVLITTLPIRKQKSRELSSYYLMEMSEHMHA